MQMYSGDIIKDTLILDPEKDWISWPKSLQRYIGISRIKN